MTRMGCNHAGVKLAVSCPATTATRWLLYWPHVYSSAVYDVLLTQSLKNHMWLNRRMSTAYHRTHMLAQACSATARQHALQ
jgi:hypothetical protein